MDKNEIAEYIEYVTQDKSKSLAEMLDEAMAGHKLPVIVKLIVGGVVAVYAIFVDKGTRVVMKMTPHDVFCSFCLKLTVDPYVLFRPTRSLVGKVRRWMPPQHVAACYSCLSKNFGTLHEAGWDFISIRGRRAFPLPIRGVVDMQWPQGWPLPQDWDQFIGPGQCWSWPA